jgi:SAM-dependent MidA family methyltransferase
VTEPGARVGLRRAPLGALDVGSEPELVARIRGDIDRDGAITFARFMERALYEPGLGYYRRLRPAPGHAGDFLTAPETHPIFGHALSRLVADVWQRLDRPSTFVLREHGAGEGALAVAILDGLATERPDVLDATVVEPVEVEPARLEAFATRLTEAGHGGRHRSAGVDPITGLVLANEVLDALPVHRVVQRGAILREVLVGWRDGRFVDVEAQPTTPALAARLADHGIELVDGQRAEISLGIDPWIAGAAADLERGVALLIDYGHPAAELYGPRRRAGTLAAYVNHRVHDHPLVNVGRQDITAHVDLTAVERGAQTAGLTALARTTQAELLVGLGIEELLERERSDPATTMESYVALRAGLMRLLDPAATGAFKVLAFGRKVEPDPPLRGFDFRLSRSGRSPALYG